MPYSLAVSLARAATSAPVTLAPAPICSRRASVKRERQHAQPGNQMLLAGDHLGEAHRVVVALAHGHRQRHALAAAQHLELRHVAGGAAIQVHVELPAVLDRLAVERQHDVADAQAGRAGRAVAIDVGRRSPPTPAAGRAPAAITGVIDCTTAPMRAAAHAAVAAQLVVDRAHDVARRGEAEPLVAAALREDERVDADHAARGVHQRSAAAAGVDRRVGLDVDHRVVGLELPADRAHDAHRHRVVEAERAAEREHQLAGAQRVGIAERQRASASCRRSP